MYTATETAFPTEILAPNVGTNFHGPRKLFILKDAPVAQVDRASVF